MIVEEYKYKDHTIEIHQHPLYNDFEYVIKKGNDIKCANTYFYIRLEDAKRVAESELDLI